MLRGLIHHGRIHLAVALGAAVATAVLSGALLVGDSVRASLRDLTLERLGGIDDALIAERLFPARLADDLSARLAAADPLAAAAPAILLRGSATHPDSGRLASHVAIHGIDPRFARVFGEGGDLDLERGAGEPFPRVAINETLARELEVGPGDPLVLGFALASEVPRDTLMGDRDTEDVLGRRRVQVSEVVPDRGIGRFGLVPTQEAGGIVFLELGELQRAMDREAQANAIVVARGGLAGGPAGALAEVVRLEDLGVTLRERADHLLVESTEFVFDEPLERAVRAAADRAGAPRQAVLSYLANEMRLEGRSVPYSAIAALEPVPSVPEAPWATLRSTGGGALPAPTASGVLINAWTARELGAAPGDTIEVEYYAVGAREELRVESGEFKVEGVVALEGLGADPTLTPEYPGIRGSEDMADWDPPFPVDLGRIRPADERYWDEHRATPKAFFSPETARERWGTRFGSVTSFRLGPAPGAGIEDTSARFAEALRAERPPPQAGLAFRAVKEEGLRAAAGSTDFSGLFFGFSLFLIVAAALLVGLLFMLGVERRAREIGLLLAVGYRLRSVRWRLIGEGALLAAAGGLLGVAGAVGYAWLMLAGLRTLWIGAVGSSRLELHVGPASLLLGFALSLLVVLAAVALAVRRLRKLPATVLLAGSTRTPASRGSGRLARRIAWIAALVGLLPIAVALVHHQRPSPGAAFGSGASLLVAGIAGFAAWCRAGGGASAGRLGLPAMAARNSSWNPGRSILSVALVAAASFVIVTVAANRRVLGPEIARRDSGSGGYELIAESAVPLPRDPGRAAARAELGFDEELQRRLEEVEIHSFRVLPGDDASCLNLYRPERPRILGAPEGFLRLGAFRFAGTLPLPEGTTNPWTLLETEVEPGVVPAIADANSAQWILKLGLGEELPLEDEAGRPLRLRLVATLAESVFQSEMLIAEDALLRHFPSRTGYGAFLVDDAGADASELAGRLEGQLGRFGFDAVTTRERLAAFQVVEHTYLSTFQLLGALGLLLGTVGLAVVMVRNVLERRGELATLRAFGFRRARLVALVLAENAFLLALGLAVGSAAALLAAAPRLAAIHAPWGSLAATLLLVFAVGMLAAVLAVLGALRVPLLHELKSEA